MKNKGLAVPVESMNIRVADLQSTGKFLRYWIAVASDSLNRRSILTGKQASEAFVDL